MIVAARVIISRLASAQQMISTRRRFHRPGYARFNSPPLLPAMLGDGDLLIWARMSRQQAYRYLYADSRATPSPIYAPHADVTLDSPR